MNMLSFSTPINTYDIKKSWEYNYRHGPNFNGPYPEIPKKLKWELLGHKLISPLGVAAGPLPNAKWMIPYIKLGFGSVVLKTVRSSPHKSHPDPNVLILNVKGKININSDKPLIGAYKLNKPIDKLTITNSFGNPCYNPSEWKKETAKAKKALSSGQILGVSVYGSKEEDMSIEELAKDYAKTAIIAKKAGANFIEANLACPNVEGFEDPFLYKNATAVAQASREIKSQIGNMPLILKIGYFENYGQLLDMLKASKGYFDGISAINTISKKIVDSSGNQALPNREVSGVCGWAIKEYGIDMVKKLKRAKKTLNAKFEIIGVGGAMHPNDVGDYLKAGANHIHSATAVMWNPYLAYQLNTFLNKQN